METFLAVARDAAVVAGTLVASYWRALERVDVKEGGDLVTVADREAEAEIVRRIREAFPSHAILGEESGLHQGEAGCPFRWVIDPLDGTTNFSRGFPQYAVSIALMEDALPILAVVYVPLEESVFVAQRGAGAHWSEEPLRVSSTASLQEGFFISGLFRPQAGEDRNQRALLGVNDRSRGVRFTGSAVMNLLDVARGVADGFWYRGLNIWDIAAAGLIVEEAGGRVTDYAGKSLGWEGGEIVASNGILHDQLLAVLCR